MRTRESALVDLSHFNTFVENRVNFEMRLLLAIMLSNSQELSSNHDRLCVSFIQLWPQMSPNLLLMSFQGLV